MSTALRLVPLVWLLLFAVARAATADEYLLDTGDRLRIKAHQWPEIAGEYNVAADGTVPVPAVGNVVARGLTPAQLATEIAARLNKLSRTASADASVTVVDIIRYRPIFVLGDVQKPGEYEFQPNLTVVKAISLAGGFYRPPFAGLQRLERDAIQARGDASTQEVKAIRLRIARARLMAETEDRDAFEIPDDLKALEDDPDVRAMLREARQAFAANRDETAKKISGYRAAQALSEEEIRSLEQQIASESEQLVYVKRELEKMRGLAARGLAQSPRMLDLERNAAQITGARQALETNIVRAKQEIHRLEQRIREAREEARARAREDLHDVTLALDEAETRRRTQLKLLAETEFYTASPALRSTNPVGHRFVIVRTRRDGTQQEFTTHRHASILPGDVLEVVRESDPVVGTTRAVPAGVQ